MAHAGQLFFDDAISDGVMKLPPYAIHTGTRTTNAEDTIFLLGDASTIVKLSQIQGDPTEGIRRTLQLLP